MRVLLIGSDQESAIRAALKKAHIAYDCIDSFDRGDSDIALSENIYDSAILVGNEQTEGKAFVSQMRAIRAEGVMLPVLIAAQHSSARDRIRALDAGADDFLTEPFLMGELLARVRALGRRGHYLEPQILFAGDLTLDRSNYLLSCQNGAVRLSGKELQLAELLLLHPGQILPRDTLRQKVWGCDAEPCYNNVEVYLSFLRRKLRAIGSGTRIRAERGIGYYLEVAPAESLPQ